MFAHAIQRYIITEAKESNYFGLTADGATHTSDCKQFSFSLQFVDDNLAAQNVYLRFYSPPVQPVVVVDYPTPSEGWGHGGRPWSPNRFNLAVIIFMYQGCFSHA